MPKILVIRKAINAFHCAINKNFNLLTLQGKLKNYQELITHGCTKINRTGAKFLQTNEIS